MVCFRLSVDNLCISLTVFEFSTKIYFNGLEALLTKKRKSKVESLTLIPNRGTVPTFRLSLTV
jgi:hypothetical protein